MMENNCTTRKFMLFGALSGFISVALGAFAAHGLKNRLSDHLLDIFMTGTDYQAYHALALILVSLLGQRSASKSLSYSGWLFLAGSLVFSGSLYLLALTGITKFGMITPLGGLCFLAGWAFLAYFAYRETSK